MDLLVKKSSSDKESLPNHNSIKPSRTHSNPKCTRHQTTEFQNMWSKHWYNWKRQSKKQNTNNKWWNSICSIQLLIVLDRKLVKTQKWTSVNMIYMTFMEDSNPTAEYTHCSTIQEHSSAHTVHWIVKHSSAHTVHWILNQTFTN